MNAVEYYVKVRDGASGVLAKIAGSSSGTSRSLSEASAKARVFEQAVKPLTGTINDLRKKMEQLGKKRDLIDGSNLKQIKDINREMEQLGKQIENLDRAGTRSGGLSKFLGGGLLGSLTSPAAAVAAATAAAGYVGKVGMSFDEGISKINVTAQLDPESREQMARDIKEIARKNKVDVSVAPDAFEQIISQVEDVELTKQIFDQTLKGAKAGFTDTSIVAGALAQSLSIIGQENATAAEVLDTFFAAKRVGAGEFSDFATYMPQLIAGADALGVKYKEVGGLYAYMTGKGQSPEKSAVLLDNMFSMMGRGDVQESLKKANVNIFDQAGNIRPMLEVFREMKTLMDPMSNKQKSNFLEAVGINRLEAKKAFMVMTADLDKLGHSLEDVNNASGEADRALEFSHNSTQLASEVWATFKGHIVDLGTAALPMICGGLDLLNGIMEGTVAVVRGIGAGLGWWYDKMNEGNPWVWAATAAIAAGTAAFYGHAIASGVATTAQLIWEGATKGLTIVMGGLMNALRALKAFMFSNPWTLAIAGIAALAAGITALLSKTNQATKVYAAFNSELRNTQAESKGEFEAAMQAKEGSQERADAIARINDKYGKYLPSLLTEKSTNDELAVSLSLVNGELEKKIRLKFRDQALEGAMGSLQETEDKLYSTLLEGFDASTQKEVATRLRDEFIPRLQAGEEAAVSELSKYIMDTRREHKVHADAISWETLRRTGNKYLRASSNYEEQKQVIDIQFGEIAPEEPTQVTNIFNGTDAPLEGVIPTDTQNDNTSIEALIAKLNAGGRGKGSNSKTETWDLDKIEGVNKKGSAGYGAIMSRIGRVQMAGLMAAAGVAGVSLSSPGLTPPSQLHNSAVETPMLADSKDYSQDDRKTFNQDKFCDQVVIHLAKGDDVDDIERKVTAALRRIIDGNDV